MTRKTTADDVIGQVKRQMEKMGDLGNSVADRGGGMVFDSNYP